MKYYLAIALLSVLLGGCTNSENRPGGDHSQPAEKPVSREERALTLVGDYVDLSGEHTLEIVLDGDAEELSLRILSPTVLARHYPRENPYSAFSYAVSRPKRGEVTQTEKLTLQFASDRSLFIQLTETGDPNELQATLYEARAGHSMSVETLLLKRETRNRRVYELKAHAVRGYLDQHRDLDESTANLELAQLTQYVRDGRKTLAKRVIEAHGLPRTTNDHAIYHEALTAAVRTDQGELVKLLLPYVPQNQRRKMHCEISTGVSAINFAPEGAQLSPFRAPTYLERSWIFNLLLSSMDEYQPCDQFNELIFSHGTDDETLRILSPAKLTGSDLDFILMGPGLKIIANGFDLIGSLKAFGYFESLARDIERLRLVLAKTGGEWPTEKFQALLKQISIGKNERRQIAAELKESARKLIEEAKTAESQGHALSLRIKAQLTSQNANLL